MLIDKSPGSMNAATLPVLWLTLAVSSLVVIEPAPYDILVLLALLGFFLTGMRIPRAIQLPALFAMLFIVGNALASALAVDPVDTIRSLSIRIYMVMAWFFFVCVIAMSPGRVLPTLWSGYTFAAVFAVTWATLEYFGFISTGDWPQGWRARGPFKDPNVYGPFLVPVAVYAVSRVATGHRYGFTLFLPLFLLFSFGILISFSRGAWLNYFGSLVIFFALFFLSDKAARSRVRMLAAGLVLTCCAALMVVLAVSNERVGGLFFERAAIVQKYDVAQGGRFYSQQLALQTAAQQPWGIGPGRSDAEFGLEPHNLYLHVLVEGGWLSAIGFYTLILLSFYRIRPLVGRNFPYRAEAFVVIAGLTGILAQSFFIDSTHWRHLWLLVAMLWGLIAISGKFSPKI